MTGMLTQCDLDYIGSIVGGSFDASAAHMRATRTQDGIGGTTKAWTDLETVPCRLKPSSLRFLVVEDRVTTVTVTTLVLPSDTNVEMADRFIIDGDIWSVDGVPVPHGATMTVGVTLVRP